MKWVDNMMGRVEFASSLKALALESEVDILLEVGPHAALAGPVRQIIQASDRLRGASTTYASVLRIKESAAKSVVTMAATLAMKGVPVDLRAVHGTTTTSAAVVMDLPSYPWNKSRSYWAESRLSREFRNCPYPRQDLLGRPEPNFNPLDSRWRNFVRTAEIPWLRDHRIESKIVYPAAGYIAMAIEAVKQRAPRALSAYRLREIVFGQALIIEEDDEENDDDDTEIFISLRSRSDGTRKTSSTWTAETEWREFAIYSVSKDNRWTEHCRGLITAEADPKSNKALPRYSSLMDGMENVPVTPIHVGHLYETLRRVGLDYGPTFANMTEARIGRTMPSRHARDSIGNDQNDDGAMDICLAEVAVPDTAVTMPAGFEYPHVLHPAALDAIFHSVFPPFYAPEQDRHPVLREPMVPTFIESLVVFDGGGPPGSNAGTRRPGDRFDVFTSAKRRDGRQTRAEIAAFSRGAPDAGIVIEMRGVTLTRLSQDVGYYGSAGTTVGQDKVFNVEWVLDVGSLDGHAVAAELVASEQPEARALASLRRTTNLGLRVLRQAVDSATELDLRTASPPNTAAFCQYAKGILGHRSSFAAEKDAKAGEATPEEDLLDHVKDQLPDIIAGTETWRSVMEGEEAAGLLQTVFEQSTELLLGYERIGHYLDLMSAQNPSLHILEVGAGAGWLTPRILHRIGGADGSIPRFDKYRIVPGSSSETAKTRLRGILEPWLGDAVCLEKLALDGRREQDQQDLPSPHTLDVVVCCHLSNSVASMATAIKTLHRLLKPGGTIILLEPRQKSPTALALYGTCPSWWSHGAVDGTTKDDAGPRNWHSGLEESGFVDIVDVPHSSPATADAEEDVVGDSAVNSLLIAKSPRRASVSPERSPPVPILLICGDTTTREIQGNPSLSGLAALLRGSGHQVTTASSLEDADPAGKMCVVAWNNLLPTVLSNPTEEEFRALQDLFLKSRGVLSIIRGARSHSPVLNMVVGMNRTVRSEIGESRLLVLDIEDKAGRTTPDQDVVKAVGALLDREFLAGNVASPSAAGASDTEFSLQRGLLMVPRLIPDKAASRAVMAASAGQDNGTPTPQEEVWTQPGRLLRAEISTPGLLDTIHFVDDDHHHHHHDVGLAANAVEIEVKAVGLNSRDVMMAMGQIELETLGAEASGVVTTVGEGVRERFAVGDRVACLHLGTIRSFVRADSRFVQQLPPDMGFDTGAALPGAHTISKRHCCCCCCCCCLFSSC